MRSQRTHRKQKVNLASIHFAPSKRSEVGSKLLSYERSDAFAALTNLVPLACESTLVKIM